jgi:hypothetical protein
MKLVQHSNHPVCHNRRDAVLWWLAATSTVVTAWPAHAAKATNRAEQLYAAAVDSFRGARYPEAFGRFVALADAGHAKSAGIALWMWQQGPELFGKDWDCSPDQLDDWSRLAGVPTPPMPPRHYGRHAIEGATLKSPHGALPPMRR